MQYACNNNTTNALRVGDIVEFVGLTASGKTALLIHIILTTILPQHVPELDLHVGGRYLPVLLFDCDGRFPIDRLRQLLVSHVQQQQEHPSLRMTEHDAVKSIVDAALDRLRVYQPTSSGHFIACLQHALHILPAYDVMPFILVDGISAFHYIDALKNFVAEKSLNPVSGPILKHLKELAVRHCSCIIATRANYRPNLSATYRSSSESEMRMEPSLPLEIVRPPGEFLGRPWHEAVRYVFQLCRIDASADGRTCTTLLSRMVKPALTFEQRRQGVEFGDLFQKYGIIPWEIQDEGIASYE